LKANGADAYVGPIGFTASCKLIQYSGWWVARYATHHPLY